MNEAQLMVDILDIMCSMNKGFSIADLLVQLNNLYATRGEQVEQAIIRKVLDDLTEQGYLKTYTVGVLPSWKITPEGEDFFYSL